MRTEKNYFLRALVALFTGEALATGLPAFLFPRDFTTGEALSSSELADSGSGTGLACCFLPRGFTGEAVLTGEGDFLLLADLTGLSTGVLEPRFPLVGLETVSSSLGVSSSTAFFPRFPLVFLGSEATSTASGVSNFSSNFFV